MVGARDSAPPFVFHDQYSLNDTMDFGMEEFLPSNVLDLNFLEVCNEEIQGKGSTVINGDNRDNDVLDFSNHPFSFGEGTLEHQWMTEFLAFESMKLNVSTLPLMMMRKE